MRLSVVIPTRNRWGSLKGCLASLAKQTRQADEVLVVDNGSSDGTAAGLRAEFPRGVRRLCEPEPGIHHARNRGIREAAGAVVAFTDDDCLPPPGWLAALETCFKDPAVGGAGGPVFPEWDSPPPAWVRGSRKALGALGLGDLGGARRAIDPETDFLIGSNCAYRKALISENAGFRAVLACPGVGICGEDYELSRRIAADHPVIYEPAAHIRHRIESHRPAWGPLMRRAFYYEAVRARLGGSLKPRRPLGGILRRESALGAAVLLGHLYGRFTSAGGELP